MHSDICCGLYRGSIYLRDISDPTAGLLPVGNAEATINQTMAETSVPNYESLGGTACKIAYTESMTISLVLHCTSPENLAMAFLGEAYQATSEVVTGEKHTVKSEGQLIAFNKVPDLKQPLDVKAGATTYVANRDYKVTGAGIIILEGTTIPMNTELEIDYTAGQNWVIQTQTKGQKTFELVLDGMNYGGGEPRAVVLKLWQVRLSPTDSFALIAGTDFASINMTGEVLRDGTKVSDSAFGKIEFAVSADGAY